MSASAPEPRRSLLGRFWDAVTFRHQREEFRRHEEKIKRANRELEERIRPGVLVGRAAGRCVSG